MLCCERRGILQIRGMGNKTPWLPPVLGLCPFSHEPSLYTVPIGNGHLSLTSSIRCSVIECFS